MFYLTYRPKTIQELDNTNVKEKLTNILQGKNLPHAFLLVGQKGTGKTSSARILAKAVNCLSNSFAEKSKDVEPCNNCANCLAIDTGSSPDVIEQDAASNRGIEEVRNLIREASFSPMTSRYRVFIIDEAHMITNDAFNALLKTLEEPPKAVIFILATTNEEKVPKTIVSRCVVVHFGKAKREDVATMLQRIIKNEKVTVDQKVISLVASHSERSFRDASKLMEELITQNKLTEEEAKNYLGIRSQRGLLELIQSKPLKDSLAWVEKFSETGGSTKNLLEDLLEELRYALLVKNGIQPQDGVEYTFSVKEITVLMKLFSEAYSQLRISPIESIPLEIAVVEFYNRKEG